MVTAARVTLETGELGEDWLFGADGTSEPASRLEPALEAIAEDQTNLFNVIAREANANQVTFYTLDALSGDVLALGVNAR